jgi:hypothetical protein
VIAIDQRIGIEERPAKCHAHAGVARGAGNGLGLVQQGGAVLRVVAVIDGGHARSGEAGKGKGGRVIGIDARLARQVDHPVFERRIGHPAGERGEATAMIVGIGQRGHGNERGLRGSQA